MNFPPRTQETPQGEGKPLLSCHFSHRTTSAADSYFSDIDGFLGSLNTSNSLLKVVMDRRQRLEGRHHSSSSILLGSSRLAQRHNILVSLPTR